MNHQWMPELYGCGHIIQGESYENIRVGSLIPVEWILI